MKDRREIERERKGENERERERGGGREGGENIEDFEIPKENRQYDNTIALSAPLFKLYYKVKNMT